MPEGQTSRQQLVAGSAGPQPEPGEPQGETPPEDPDAEGRSPGTLGARPC